MEETPRELHRVLAAQREALAATCGGTSDADLSGTVPADGRSLVLRRLGSDIERVYGIAMTGGPERKLAQMLRSVDLAELGAWTDRLRLLPENDPEWLSLIEALTVHETFFYRDPAQLALLSAILRDLAAAADATGTRCLRLWSAGCATGEEAYMLAILGLIALRDAGFADEYRRGEIVCRPPWQVDVLGTDVSRVVLMRARTAIYSTEGLNTFRDLPAEFEQFFPALPGHPTAVRGVLPAVARHVRFQRFNLMEAAPPATGFDVVLCRNVLMYLTEAARAAAQARLAEGLRPGGYLLLGPTDVVADRRAYETCWGGDAVGYTLKRPR